MMTRLLTLVQSKIALAVLGVLVVSGSGAAVVAAHHAQDANTPLATASPASHASGATPGAGDHAHTVALEGTLTAYAAGSHTISVQTKESGSATVVSVDSNTRVDGEHASSLSDLAHAIGHDVQVQADKQSNGALLAWKITVQGGTSGNGQDNHGNAGNGNGNGDNGAGGNGNSQQHAITGTVASVGTSSFTVTVPGHAPVTVTVSGSTQFEGSVRGMSDLKSGMHVSVEGALQSNGDLAATRIEAQGGN